MHGWGPRVYIVHVFKYLYLYVNVCIYTYLCHLFIYLCVSIKSYSFISLYVMCIKSIYSILTSIIYYCYYTCVTYTHMKAND